MAVVVVGVGAQDMVELPPAEDEQPVEALATHTLPTQRSAWALAFGAWTGGADHRDPFSLEDVIEAAAELASRSWMRKRSGCLRSSTVIRRLRACWATQAPFGFAVQATNSIRRRSREMKKST
jgi:hypothetical protein